MSDFQELQDNYSKCYGKTSLKFGSHPVLILIDPVVAYLSPTSPLYAPLRFESARLSMISLLAKARSASIPVIFTSVVYNSPSEGGKWYMEKLPNVLCCYDKGNPLREFAEGVSPEKGEVVVEKRYASSFFGTGLGGLLGELGCDCTILAGYSTSGCVRATALDSMQHDFPPFVVREACGDRHESVNDSNLFDMQQKFAEVVSEEDIMTLIDGMKKA